jgi:hypothetical protein
MTLITKIKISTILVFKTVSGIYLPNRMVRSFL